MYLFHLKKKCNEYGQLMNFKLTHSTIFQGATRWSVSPNQIIIIFVLSIELWCHRVLVAQLVERPPGSTICVRKRCCHGLSHQTSWLQEIPFCFGTNWQLLWSGNSIWDQCICNNHCNNNNIPLINALNSLQIYSTCPNGDVDSPLENGHSPSRLVNATPVH